jgi:TPP-dependent 2-oxoacid decarboxylase
VFTTYNVGAYSALNGVAGAYAERLPVIFVSSGPNTNDPVANHIMHHTMGTHDFSDQYEVCRQVTCEAVRILHADNAPTLIDQAISTALRERKPVYIEIACNLSAAPCPEPAPIDTLLASTMLSFQPTNPRALTAAVDRAGQQDRLFCAPTAPSTPSGNWPKRWAAQWRSCPTPRASSPKTTRNTRASTGAR